MKNPTLYDKDVYEDVVDRIKQITAETKPGWGKMNAAQMLAHCAEIQEVANGSKPLNGTPLVVKLFKKAIRRMVVNDRPYKHNTKTHPQYRQNSDNVELEAQRARLLKALEVFFEDQNRSNIPHPLFGKLSTEEKGWAMYKHHNYHLEQFGLKALKVA